MSIVMEKQRVHAPVNDVLSCLFYHGKLDRFSVVNLFDSRLRLG